MEKVFLVVLLDKFPLYTPAEGDEEFPPVIKSFVDVVVANRIEHAHNIACKHTGINRELDTNNLVYETNKAAVEVHMYNTAKESDFYRVFFANNEIKRPEKIPVKLIGIINRIPSLFKRQE